MSENTDTLVKPDMPAVLSRTHLDKNLHGFLLPILEAISNGIHGIETRFDAKASEDGKIKVQFLNFANPAQMQVIITDNGIGLNDENYRSFLTPFSGLKLKRKGRGFGRFIAFKVFSHITYASRFKFFDKLQDRHFKFDIHQDEEIIFLNEQHGLDDSGVSVNLKSVQTDWHDAIRGFKKEDVADEIGSHFLPQFLYGWLPEIKIQFDDAEPEDITSHFKEIFVQSESGHFECDIDGETSEVQYSIAKVPKNSQFKSHCLLFSAADRIVGTPRDLSNKIGQPFFTDEGDKKYVVVAVVKSDAFESRLNDARTGINLGPKSVERIVSGISDVIQVGEKHQIEKIKTAQSTGLGNALKENPILRIGLRGKSINEYVSGKPNNWSPEEFVSDLAIERYRATSDLTKAITNAAANEENYDQTIKDIVGKIDENKKEALAEYVIHRKNIIELVEAARKFGDNGKRAPEDVIHDLIFKRFSDTTNIDYFEHNLWLIDDALAFSPYVSSDRTSEGGKRKKGDKVADLAFFDDSLILGDNDGTTINIVEFKKPSRDDYRFGNEKSDPVLQVISTLEKATDAGGITKIDGTHFRFSGVIRRFAYIIADHTGSLIDVLKMHDFKNEYNPNIFFRYRDNEQIYIQAIGYDTLVENAKKRNQAFFTVLLDE